jgi:hypothetical protein
VSLTLFYVCQEPGGGVIGWMSWRQSLRATFRSSHRRICAGRLAASVRLVPGWLTVAAWPGAACLFVAAMFTVALANGAPWVGVGLIGFIIWLVFLVTASVRLIRGGATP